MIAWRTLGPAFGALLAALGFVACTVALPFSDEERGNRGPGPDADVSCGNGNVDPGEECDDGASNSDTAADACRTSCLRARCGDGVVDSGEVCDDGNLDAGDGCDASCLEEPCTTVGALVAQSGCGPDACDVVQSTIECRTAGQTAHYSPCSASTDCRPGATCFALSGQVSRCLPFCPISELGASGACPGIGVCLHTFVTPVGSVGLCQQPAACDPPDNTGCPALAGLGCFVVFGDTFCLEAATAVNPAPCTPITNECLAGYFCDSGTCRQACHIDATPDECTLATCSGVTGAPNIGYCR